jgi:trigger factor
MQVTETLSEGLKRGFTVVVPGPDIEGKRTARLSEISRTLRLPGFRPGKVPLPIVRQRYGTAVMAEVLEESVNDATRQMLADRGLRSAVQPKVELVSGADPAAGKEAADLEFKVEVELLPEITLPDLSDLALVRLKSEPTAEVIDAALAEVAKRQSVLTDVTDDRGAEPGETLTVDYLGKIDGVAFPGGTGTDMSVEVGGTGFIPGFSEQMAGMKVGESRTIDVTFPEEYGAKELAGKAATFELTAKALRRSEVPAIDDAMATKMGFEDGLEKMREAVAATIQREYDQVSRLRLKRDLLDQLAGKADFAVPESLVEPEFKQIWDRIEADRAAGKTDEDDAGKDDDTLRADYRAIAERRVRLGLLLAEIGRANGIQVGQDELMRAMRAEASRYQGQERQVMEFFQKNPQAVESLRGPIFEEKVVDYIVELAKVEDKAVTVEELNAEPAPSAALG